MWPREDIVCCILLGSYSLEYEKWRVNEGNISALTLTLWEYEHPTFNVDLLDDTRQVNEFL